MQRAVYIHAIRTAVPGFRSPQKDIYAFMAAQPGQNADSLTFLQKIYEHSAIETRYSVLPDFTGLGRDAMRDAAENASALLFADGEAAGTRQRNDIFVAAAKAGSTALCKSFFDGGPPIEGSPLSAGISDCSWGGKDVGNVNAEGEGKAVRVQSPKPAFLAGPGAGTLAPDFDAKRITHLITVSCTGFSAPGFDFDIQDALGLSKDLQKTHIGFMGCYATFPALRLANSICTADPSARVLIVSVEFCTLHFQNSTSREVGVANSLFADGMGAMLVSADRVDSARLGRGRPLFRIDALVSRYLGGGERAMAWSLGDKGFLMRLSAYVPKLIEENIEQIIADICEEGGISRSKIRAWALHPGGRAILDRFCQRLELAKTELVDSYGVLLNYGNMSSAAIAFVLAGLAKRLDLEPANGGSKSEPVFAASFGPGLTVEAAVLSFLPARQRLRYGVVSTDLPAFLPQTRFRVAANELMDNPAVDRAALGRTYMQFWSINRNLSAYRRILSKEIFGKIAAHSGEADPVSVLDLGCGSGDILIWMAKQARKRGLAMRFLGADPDSQALELARKHGAAFPEIAWVALDSSGLDAFVAKHGKFDWIISNHVLHHLSEAGAVELIRSANAAAKRGIVINDIRRSALGYLGYRIYSALFARRSLARYDGSLSVLRSLSFEELDRIAAAAGSGELLVRSVRPFRLLVTRRAVARN